MSDEAGPSQDPSEQHEHTAEEENNAEDSDDSDVVTMTLKEVVELEDLEDELMENSTALLGAASDKICSYNEGYLKRQALYSCLTCIPEAKEDPEKAGGFCLACSFHCHDGHDLVELYTKRNFRCDCGNSKFQHHSSINSNNKCTLNAEKSALNELNLYNQNFSGSYCVCHRPFPDVEDPIPDEMIQCIICEDWYHSRHLGVEVPTDNFAEMTCEQCMIKHQFLLYYDHLTTTSNTIQENEEIEVTEGVEEEKKSEENDQSSECCKKPKEKSSRVTTKFWLDTSWRKQLCTCDDCLKMYENEDVAFLLDPEDPVHLYEERGKAKVQAAVEDQSKKFMDSMDRVQLMEVILGYNDLKEQLGGYLKKCCENKKVIRKEDIEEFFEGMRARKKPRLDIPYNCR